MVLTFCYHNIVYILPPLDTRQTLGQTDRLPKLLFFVPDHLCCKLENEPDVYAMDLRSSGFSPA